MSRAVAAPLDLEALLRRLAASDPAIWVDPPDPGAIGGAVAVAADRGGPLEGRTFSVKDNIDVVGVPTTGGLPLRRRPADRSAPVVDRVVGAGAVYVGKANLDQLATGLVGVRSPYGVPGNPIDAALVPGGSSSGSAVGVATGVVDFSLATDTAGSGRVPAACCGVVGLKPAPGILPLDGVLPASPSFDCVSVVTRTVADALLVADVLGAGFPTVPTGRRLAVGTPDAESLAVLPPPGRRALELDASALVAAGHEVGPVAMGLLFSAGDLLYEGAWLAERTAAVGDLLAEAEGGVVEVVRQIVDGGRRYSGVEVFRAVRRLEALRAEVAPLWDAIDVLVVPSVPEVPTLAAVAADPIGANQRLGRYTTFANLLGLAAITVPRGRRDDGTPASATVLAPHGREAAIARVALDLELGPEPASVLHR
jgi:allophanate hydrolase